MSTAAAAAASSLTPEQEHKVQQLRTTFLARAAQTPEAFNACDLDLVQTNEWWTLRFLKWNRFDEAKALEQMLTAFRWRRSFGLHQADAKELPLEFVQAGAIFPFGVDNANHQVIVIRIKVYRKIARLSQVFRLYVTHIVERVDREAGAAGFVFLFDVTDMSMAAVDLDFLQFLIDIAQKYYPYGLRYTICYNVPSIVRPLWSLAKPFLGPKAERFCFVNRQELLKLIPAEHVLRYMGGTSDFDFTSDYPEVKNCKPVAQLSAKYGFTAAETEKFIAMFAPTIRETLELVRRQKLHKAEG